MPSWPEQTKYISHATTRVDAPAKVTGRARYSSDIQADGWLYGMILRSKWPAAKISAINLDKALQVPGIKAAITAKDLPKYRPLLRRGNCRGLRHDQAGLPRRLARHRSQGRSRADLSSAKTTPKRTARRKSGKASPTSRRAARANRATWTRRSPNAPPSSKVFTRRRCRFIIRWKRTATRFPGRTTA